MKILTNIAKVSAVFPARTNIGIAKAEIHKLAASFVIVKGLLMKIFTFTAAQLCTLKGKLCNICTFHISSGSHTLLTVDISRQWILSKWAVNFYLTLYQLGPNAKTISTLL